MKTNHAIIGAISVFLSTWTLSAQDNQQSNPPSVEGQPQKENATHPEEEKAQRPKAKHGETSRGERPQQMNRPTPDQRQRNWGAPRRGGGNFAPRGQGWQQQRGERPQFGPRQDNRPDGPQRNFALPPPPQQGFGEERRNHSQAGPQQPGQGGRGDGRRFGHHSRHHHKWQSFGGDRQQYGMERPRRDEHRGYGPQQQPSGRGFAQQGERRMDARSQGAHQPFAGRPNPQEMQHLFEMMRERWAQVGSRRDYSRPQPPPDGPRFQQQGKRRMDARSQNWRPRFSETPDFQQRDSRFERMHPQGPAPMNRGPRDMHQGSPPPQRDNFAPPQGEREPFGPRRRPPQDDWQERRR